jgi:pimeloyl-ACP methyl ester carboxylesterase
MAEISDLRRELFFRSYNDSSSSTIVLIHGLFSCNLEWGHVIPYLNDYHLIVPDLPQHSKSKHVGPWSLELGADTVADLIRNHAHGGQAHVVGLSLGGFTTMEIIRRHPELVKSAFITGAAPFIPWQIWIADRPSLLHYGLKFVLSSGIYTFSVWKAGLKEHAELKNEIAANNDWTLVDRAYGGLAKWGQEAVGEVAAKDKRILAIAGDQGDNVEGMKEMAEKFRQEGSWDGKKSTAYVVKDAIHGWNLQFPELFAQGIQAWVEEKPLPEGFASLLKD